MNIEYVLDILGKVLGGLIFVGYFFSYWIFDSKLPGLGIAFTVAAGFVLILLADIFLIGMFTTYNDNKRKQFRLQRATIELLQSLARPARKNKSEKI